MAAEVFSLESKNGEQLPCILMAHGWGGTVRGLRRDAIAFAKAGYLAVAFDYRGWGNSGARVILAEPAPDKGATRFEAEVIAIREVVDPVDQTRDWLNAMHWLQAEPIRDASRIGTWGSSYSGGHVLYVAAHRRRRPWTKRPEEQVANSPTLNRAPSQSGRCALRRYATS